MAGGMAGHGVGDGVCVAAFSVCFLGRAHAREGLSLAWKARVGRVGPLALLYPASSPAVIGILTQFPGMLQWQV